MGDTPRQPADRFHFLRLKKLCFQLLPFVDILNHMDGVLGVASSIPDERNIDSTPNHSSIFSNTALLYLVMILFPRQQLLIEIQIHGLVFHMSEFRKIPGENFFFSIT